METKIYLGDGAYATFEGFQVILTTEDGVRVHNEIALEKDHILKLIQFLIDNGWKI